MPLPPYQTGGSSALPATVSVKGNLYSARKLVQTMSFALTQTIASCSSFTLAQATSNVQIACQNNATFTIIFITGHYVPAGGIISLFFPASAYATQSFLSYAVTCTVSRSGDSCRVGGTTRFDIVLSK
jgi:hypothetical protein